MLILICCIDQNKGIGKDNKIPWNIKSEMAFFKQTTLNHMVVMGYNTFLSLNKRPLVNRENIVFTSKQEQEQSGFRFMNEVNEIVQLAKKQDVFIIGGAKLYSLFEPYYDKLLINQLFDSYNCDTFLNISLENFKLIKAIKHDQFVEQIFIRKE